MAQVHGNPAEMRKFATALHKFTQELDNATKRIDQASKQVGNAWNDQEYRKFMQEWQQAVQGMRRFINEAPRYEQHVKKKAQALEAYLKQGGV